MDLEVARKSSSKRSAFSAKRIAFAAIAGLVLVAGVALRASDYFGETSPESEPAPVAAPAPAASPPAKASESVVKTPPVTQEAAPPAPNEPAATQEAVPPPPAPAESAGNMAEQAAPNTLEHTEQAESPGSGMILVSRRPVEVLAGPSASAPAMYGFPAGRPFRVISRQGGFVQIKDLRSSASGWIDETALAAPPPRAPAVTAPSQSKPGIRKPATASADPKQKAAKKGAPAVADSEPAADGSNQARRPPALFGRGGFFGGIFGND